MQLIPSQTASCNHNYITGCTGNCLSSSDGLTPLQNLVTYTLTNNALYTVCYETLPTQYHRPFPGGQHWLRTPEGSVALKMMDSTVADTRRGLMIRLFPFQFYDYPFKIILRDDTQQPTTLISAYRIFLGPFNNPFGTPSTPSVALNSTDLRCQAQALAPLPSVVFHDEAPVDVWIDTHDYAPATYTPRRFMLTICTFFCVLFFWTNSFL
jgi:hypothetical protein